MTLFGKKKNGVQADIRLTVTSRLQELCGGDEELYRALSNLMFLDPGKIFLPLENVINEARDYEMKGNSVRAEVGYRIAGGVSLYKGDTDGVRTYFGKAASLSNNARPEYTTLAKRADEAVTVARKYYENSDSIRI